MPVQTAVNHPAAEAISAAVGKLIVNFGAVEFETYVWLTCPQGDVESLPVKELFKPRVKTLLDKLASLDHPNKDAAVGLWNDALVIADFRNRIAHNPVFFGWNDSAEEGPPSFLKVLDMKGGLQGGYAQATVSLAEINQHVNQTATLAQQLSALRKQIW